MPYELRLKEIFTFFVNCLYLPYINGFHYHRNLSGSDLFCVLDRCYENANNNESDKEYLDIIKQTKYSDYLIFHYIIHKNDDKFYIIKRFENVVSHSENSKLCVLTIVDNIIEIMKSISPENSKWMAKKCSLYLNNNNHTFYK